MAQRYLVPAVKRAFQIIELLARKSAGLRLSEFRDVLRLPISSVAVIIYTLEDLGYLERESESGRYHLSVKMFGISRRAQDRIDLVARCHGLLERAVEETGLTGHLAVLRGGESVYVDRVASDGLVQVSSYVGQRWPAHVSAAGKALLAFLSSPELRRIVGQIDLKRLTPETIASKQALLKQFAQFRRLGYTWEKSEGELGVGCVAAPVFGSERKLLAAMCLTGTIHQLSKAKIPALGSLVKRYAQQMSGRLGGGS